MICVHGFPESSLMWEPLLAALAERRPARRSRPTSTRSATRPTSARPRSSTASSASARWIERCDLDRVSLVVHDWGGFIGLAWACEHPDRVEALVISDTGFFADGKWHGMAQAMRSDQGEEIVAGARPRRLRRRCCAPTATRFADAAIDAYWAPFADGRGQRATLEFYRSMDFEKLAPYEGKLAELGVPDAAALGRRRPVRTARRRPPLRARDPRRAAGRDRGRRALRLRREPERCVAEVLGFLDNPA